MPQSVKNYTFSLPIDLLSKLKDYSNNGYITSVNSAVKDALETYLKSLEKQKLYDDMKVAASDPMFMDDLTNSMNDFNYTDFELTKELEK